MLNGYKCAAFDRQRQTRSSNDIGSRKAQSETRPSTEDRAWYRQNVPELPDRAAQTFYFLVLFLTPPPPPPCYCTEMRSVWFLLLLGYLSLHKSVTASEHTAAGEDRLGAEAEPLEKMIQGAETVLIRSILEEGRNGDALGADSPPAERVLKRQHPGKRLVGDLEKRQHPGKRQPGQDEEDGGWAPEKRQHPGRRELDGVPLEVQARQHPGRRELDGVPLEVQARQHPGRRSTYEPLPGESTARQLDTFLGELSKRQHPGKRSVMYGQRPGHWSWQENGDDSGESQYNSPQYLEAAGGSSEFLSPCDLQESGSCSKVNSLLALLSNTNKDKAEVKRQHPGRRLASDEEMQGRA
ncbi:pro-thyrotropin-releasing hormone [Chiloscyllium plagiosum]|uniref:pro-thyrotropin-releasing hormone n=1 Tax=Chiloscyllium plagiosum TaxID=36176 RepID=UPI001CB83439|nr:pro-thyrotropin-releasing hormone [Chiloscyllium plagiosum]